MRLSVFTPSNDPRYLNDCYRSLARQSEQSWEWVVLLNGKAPNWRPPEADERVKIFRAHASLRGVGAAKRQACEHASGDVLVELDHDDVLVDTALAEVATVFGEHEDVVCVYSDFAQISEDGSPNTDRFNEAMGWQYSDVEVDGTVYLAATAMESTPHNVGYIWYAPNHIRAFRRTAYDEVGGYDASLEVLDDQELMMRLFAVGEFHRIPKLLYLQRVHGRNTQVEPSTNAFIQQQTVTYYQQNIEALLRAWSARRGLKTIALTTPTTLTADDWHDDDVVTLDPAEPALPHADGSVGLIRASDVLQRIPDRAAFFNECYRVLAHSGMVLSETPSTDGRGAFQDPSHVAFYNENSFWYVTQSRFHSSIPTLNARFQVGHLRTYHPTSWHEQVHIPYVQAHLVAVKDGPRNGGLLLI